MPHRATYAQVCSHRIMCSELQSSHSLSQLSQAQNNAQSLSLYIINFQIEKKSFHFDATGSISIEVGVIWINVDFSFVSVLHFLRSPASVGDCVSKRFN